MLNPEIRIILVLLVALFSAKFVRPKLAWIIQVIGLVDKPSKQRKVHKIPRHLVGGIGIIISAAFTSLIFVPITDLWNMAMILPWFQISRFGGQE